MHQGLLIFALIMFALDLYFWQAIRTLFRKKWYQRWSIIRFIYWSFAVLSVLLVVSGNFIGFDNWSKEIRTYVFAGLFVIYISKLIAGIVLLMEDIVRGLKLFVKKVINFFSSRRKVSEEISEELRKEEEILSEKMSRSEFISSLAVITSMIPFSSLVYGMVKGAYNFKVRRIPILSPNLPGAFSGLKVVQVSDIHSGSFLSAEPIQEVARLIAAEKPDMILFTGDLVNERSSEAEMFMKELEKIQAPMGVYSVLGNHDYGDYVQWPAPHEKAQNLDRLVHIQKELGWNLMRNENRVLERDGEKIALVGVENWSAFGRFPRYGDLKRSLAGTEKTPYKILMSHDPSHWNAEITGKEKIDLTLSGHTHGMQFGVEIPGFKWSPVEYFYEQWAGLYSKGNQHLYVNRGLGFIGYPGRVGILPEITVLEFKKV